MITAQVEAGCLRMERLVQEAQILYIGSKVNGMRECGIDDCMNLKEGIKFKGSP